MATSVSICVFVHPRGAVEPILDDHRERIQTMRDVQRFVTRTDEAFSGRNTIVIGGWEPIISVLHPESRNRWIYLLSPGDARQLVVAGEPLAYASEVIRGFNYRVYGIDLAAIGGRNVRETLIGKP